jgi:hypothetical protein
MKSEPPEGKEPSLSSSASSYRSASSRAINIPEGLGFINNNNNNLYSQSYLDNNNNQEDDEKYRKLKMKYFTSLKVVPNAVAHSAPVIKFPVVSRSAPIAIPEKTRRAEDFFYKSPVDDALDQQDDACQFALEL